MAVEIVLATTNLHKIREFREMFKALKFVDLLSLLNFPDYIPPEETEATFEGNANLKAIHAAHALKKWVIADDSGLVVPALGGAPGIYSRRYAGEHATDKENREKLLYEMRELQSFQRSAYFQCTLALAGVDGLCKTVTGTVEGVILEEERGREGFGYDAVFQQHDSYQSFAQISSDHKNKISHRHKAFKKLVSKLEALKTASSHP